MTRHHEYQKRKLTKVQELATKSAQKDLTRVRHTVNLGIAELELADNVASIP